MNENLPNHIAIIMDGNGRWAKNRFQPRLFGHRQGMKKVVEIVEYCSDLGLKNLTLYAFSTENWKRSKIEVSGLMNILVEYIENELYKLVENNVKVNILGELSSLPEKPKEKVLESIEKTKNNNGLQLNLALNYGGQDEIIHAMNEILKENVKSIDKKFFEKYLYTNVPVDLLIRPGGEKRLSNFLLYQMAYAEIFFSETYWPDFTIKELNIAIQWFLNRNRRFGGV